MRSAPQNGGCPKDTSSGSNGMATLVGHGFLSLDSQVQDLMDSSIWLMVEWMVVKLYEVATFTQQFIELHRGIHGNSWFICFQVEDGYDSSRCPLVTGREPQSQVQTPLFFVWRIPFLISQDPGIIKWHPKAFDLHCYLYWQQRVPTTLRSHPNAGWLIGLPPMWWSYSTPELYERCWQPSIRSNA